MRLGCQWEYESANDIQAEIMKLLPGYYNFGQPTKGCPDGGSAILSNGYAAEVAARYRSRATASDGKRPFALHDGTGPVSLRQAVHGSAPASSRS